MSFIIHSHLQNLDLISLDVGIHDLVCTPVSSRQPLSARPFSPRQRGQRRYEDEVEGGEPKPSANGMPCILHLIRKGK